LSQIHLIDITEIGSINDRHFRYGANIHFTFAFFDLSATDKPKFGLILCLRLAGNSPAKGRKSASLDNHRF